MTTGIGIIRLNANYLKEEYYGIKLFFNPCRIICRVMEKNIFVLPIVDGRRDMQLLLQRRLLG
jgi:hypothetical protein